MERTTKMLIRGIVMMVIFIILLVVIFSPVFDGKNGLAYLDSLYNSISKGSAYYIPAVKKETEKLAGKNVVLNLEFEDRNEAVQVAGLFEKSGASAELSESKLKITGDLGNILNNCIADSDSMYNNDGKKVADKYGYNERQVLYHWWIACREMDKSLTRQKKFEDAKIIDLIQKKAIETSYNYYKIVPQKITDKLLVVIISLIFYVVYTIWYGYAIMYIFEGLGLQLGEH